MADYLTVSFASPAAQLGGHTITVREAIATAITELGGSATRDQLKAKIQSLRPGTKANTIAAQLIASCVNHPSRIHFLQGVKTFPYPGRPEMRLLYRKGNTFERYDAERHGIWEIVKGHDGKLLNRRSAGGSDVEASEDPVSAFGDVVDAADPGASVFAAEAHLRDYLAKNLGQIEPGLSLYHGPDDTIGIEYETNVGIIDLLAVDASGGFVVIELKVRKTSDAVVGQALRYRNWVRHHLADGHSVRAIVVAESVTDKIRYAMEGLPDFGLLTYEIHFDVHAVPPMDHLAPETSQVEGQ